MCCLCYAVYPVSSLGICFCYAECFGTIECELYTTSTFNNVVQLSEKSSKTATRFLSLFRFDLFCKVLYSRAFLPGLFVHGP